LELGLQRGTFITAVLLTATLVWGLSVVCVVGAWRLTGALDQASGLAQLIPQPQATVVFDRQQQPAFSFYLEQRIDVPLNQISRHMTEAILAAEDRRFYSHHGLDAKRIFKAGWRNLRAGRIVEGGSTITQQLARAEQLSPVRTFARKFREMMIAARLEERYSKNEILESYLNTVYFGNGYHGVEAAARGYFGKRAAELQPAEAALLAALVRSPYSYSPSAFPERALARRNLILRLMNETDRLSDADYRQALASPLRAKTAPPSQAAEASGSPCGLYFQEEVRRELVARFGSEQVLQGGLRIYTGYDARMQCDAERAIGTRIAQIVKMRPAARDLQGGLVALDPATGEVRALVGGRDFAGSSFDRAIQARRQAGSAFKPIIYAAALERGFAPGSILRHLDDPIMTPQGPWLPAGEHEQPEYTLRAALKISSNRAAAQLLQLVGFSTTSYYAQRLGIASKLPSVPSLALGTGGVTLFELTSAYGVFANEGVSVTPRLITRVEDRQGRMLWDSQPARSAVLSKATAFLMNSMLADVISSGTATPVRANGFKLPAAGKTGTTDDYSDAWFIGYTPHLVAGVWFGMDRPARIMNRGFASIVAVPAWAQFMKQATEGDKPDWYGMPPDVEKVAICRLSGLRATDACRLGWLGANDVEAGVTQLPGGGADGFVESAPVATDQPTAGVFEDYFPIGIVPSELCPMHSAGSRGVIESDSIGTAPATGSDSTRLYVDRIRRSDGTLHFIVRQR